MSARRFYKSATATAENGVMLDARPLRTPAKAPLVLPNTALAEAIAAEWRAQGEKIDPYSMPLTKLANTAIDRVRPGRERIVEEMVAYAGNDLVCYRAGWPEALKARQVRAWDPILVWAEAALDARFAAVEGVVHRPRRSTRFARTSRRGTISPCPRSTRSPRSPARRCSP
jgi:chaperone required for assembly of F1-ATPase